MSLSDSPLLISLKPNYADLLFKGLKKAELRRRDLSRMKGRDVFVYVTSPVMQLRGGFRVGDVFIGTPNEIWDIVSEEAGVDKPEFDAYYAGRKVACALKVSDVWEYEKPMGLDELQGQFNKFVAPQSWRYLKPDELALLRSMKPSVVASDDRTHLRATLGSGSVAAAN